MKQNRSLAWLSLILFGLIVSGLAHSAEPGGELLSGKMVKIISTGIAKNRATETYDTLVTLKNVTQPKQTLYGPFTLVITKISRARVTLSNASGVTASGQPYLTLSLPAEGLEPRKAIKRVLLNFKNPSRKRFEVKYALYGYLTPERPSDPPEACNEVASAPTGPVTVKSVLPGSGPTGTVITINGTGFSTCSRVFLGEMEIPGPRYLSEKQLEIVVPFALDANQRLTPLTVGKYPIKVDSSSLVDFAVTELSLPPNPNPPGQILQDETNKLFDALKQLQPRFEALLPELLAAAKDNPEEQKFWQNLNELSQYLGTEFEPTVKELQAELDTNDLDILERLLLSKQPGPVASSRSLSASSSTTSVDATQTTGDQWLQDRANYAEGDFARNAALVSKLYQACRAASALPALAANPEAAIVLQGVCLLVSATAEVARMATEEEVARNYGLIKKMQLHVTHEVAKTTHALILNNWDNNEVNQTANARNVTGATIEITFDSATNKDTVSLYRWAKKLDQFFTGNKHFSSVINTIIDYLLKLAASKLDNLGQTIDGSRVISVSNLDWKLSDWLGVIPNFASDNCDVPASTDEWYLKDRGNGIFAVPDKGPVLTYPAHVGDCTYKILKKLRMPSEDGVSSEIQFSIQKWYKATISVGTGGRVKYPYPTPSGRDACEEGQTCVDYFYTLDPLLEAQPKNSSTTTDVKWGGTNCTDGDASCRLQLDPTNRQPPNVKVSFDSSSDGIYFVSLTSGPVSRINKPISCDSNVKELTGNYCDGYMESGTRQDYPGGNAIQLLFPACGGRYFQITRICKINGQFRPIVKTDSSSGPLSEFMTHNCSASLVFDGRTYAWLNEYNTTQDTSAVKYKNTHISKFDANLTELTFTESYDLDSYSLNKPTGDYYSTHAVAYNEGALLAATLTWVGPVVDVAACDQ